MSSFGLTARVVATEFLLLVALLAILVLAHSRTLDERRAAEIANAEQAGRAVAGITDGFAIDLDAAPRSLSAVPERLDQASAGEPLGALARPLGPPSHSDVSHSHHEAVEAQASASAASSA